MARASSGTDRPHQLATPLGIERAWVEGREQPDGTLGLGGLPLADLSLFGIERLNASPTVVLVEGEKAGEASLAVGVQAVGTATGASATPSRDA